LIADSPLFNIAVSASPVIPFPPLNNGGIIVQVCM
jgi:hypothetical protein